MTSDAADLFFYEMPLWVLVKKTAFANLGFPDGVAKTSTTDYPGVIVVFTDEDLASRYIASTGSDDLGAEIIDDADVFTAMLKTLKGRGARHVGFDCTGTHGRYATIEKVLATGPRR